jgi:hypothetical protein
MPDFSVNNLNDLNRVFKHIERIVRINIPEAMTKIKEVLVDYIMTNWYSRIGFSPSNYTRTYQYVNSIDISKVEMRGDGQISASIFFDTNKIRPLPPAFPGEWGQHQGLSGQDVSAAIPYFIEFGNNSPLYSYEGVAPVANTIRIVQQRHIHTAALADALRKAGYVVTIE